MKKLFMAFTGLVLALSLVQSVDAKTVQVTAMEDFNVSNPPQVLHVQMNANTRLGYDLLLFQGLQVEGKISKAQGGGFVFTPVSYINFQEETLPINADISAVYKGKSGLVRRNQPFYLVFPENAPDTFQYYVPSVSDMN